MKGLHESILKYCYKAAKYIYIRHIGFRAFFTGTTNCAELLVCVFQASCRVLSRLGNLASITNSDLHSRLVSMVTKTSNSPVLTWLGGVGKVGISPLTFTFNLSNHVAISEI